MASNAGNINKEVMLKKEKIGQATLLFSNRCIEKDLKRVKRLLGMVTEMGKEAQLYADDEGDS